MTRRNPRPQPSARSTTRPTTFDVRVWKIKVYKGQRGLTYIVRWTVDRRQRTETFKTRALAESFRSRLLSATREGSAFDIETGLPVAEVRDDAPSPTWFDHACAFVDMKWPHAAAKSRSSIADALATVTPALVTGDRGRPTPTVMRRALYGWAYNTTLRGNESPPELAKAVSWIRRNSLTLADLEDPVLLRRALDTLALRMDGQPAAATTVARKRAVFHAALEYAVELGHLDTNPLGRLKWTAPRVAETVDRRVVINPQQAEALLDTVSRQRPPGPQLVAFFALLYYAALRPGEAIHLRQTDCVLPDQGWGELHLAGSAPRSSSAWSNTRSTHDQRQLKHRGAREVRHVPAHPRLVRILREHIDEFGTASDGRLFAGRHGQQLSESVYGRLWQRARRLALTPEQATSQLVRRPYDLRHAAVSLWLNSGVDPTLVAEWAGHSVHVLLRVYAKCLDERDQVARRHIDAALTAGDVRRSRGATGSV